MARSTSSNVASPDTSMNVVSGRPLVLNLLTSLRPSQWTKNLLVFAGLIFGRKLFVWSAILEVMAAFAIFCGLSGAVYLVNDVLDRESDRRHPLKAKRPIASGAVGVATATATAVVLATVGLLAAFALNLRFGLVAAAYT